MKNNLKHVEGKVIVSIDLQAKNSHTFQDGTKIRIERQFDNFNRRYTEPTNAIVISGKDIPEGVEILVHPNAVADHHKIHNYKKLSGQDLASDIKYYSIPEDMCFFWRDKNDTWQPIPPFETALRVFKPYKGILVGIDPTLLKDTLFVTSGNFKGQVVKTLVSSDYEVIFQDVNGREGRLIRFRPNGCEKTKKEPEAIAILNDETKKVNKGELTVGIGIKDAKPLNELVPND